jgi:hypothetical protein
MEWEMSEMRTPVHISIFASRYQVERAVTHKARWIRRHFNFVVHLNSAPGLVPAQTDEARSVTRDCISAHRAAQQTAAARAAAARA